MTTATQKIPTGYKKTEVGLYPEDWQITQLGKLGAFKNGINKGSEAFGHGFPFVNLLDVFGVSCISSASLLGLVETINAERQAYDMRKGDVLFIRSSVKPSGVGLTAVIENTLQDTVYSGFLIRFRDNGNLADSFKKYCFYEEGFRKRVINASSVSANTNINQNSLKGLLIAFPPSKAEQEVIATALSDADGLIEKLEKLIEKKKNIKQGAMQELLTGKRRLTGFSGVWEVKKFGDIARPRKERIDPRRTELNEFCIELEHIEQGTGRLVNHTTTAESSSIKSIFQKDDVLFGKLRAYLRKYWIASRQGVCSTEIWVFAADRSLLIPQFLFQIVQMDKFIDVASSAYGTHMPRSDWNIVKTYEVPLPSLDEQIAIATILSDMDAEIESLESQLAKYKNIKQGMMQNLLTGKIRLI